MSQPITLNPDGTVFGVRIGALRNPMTTLPTTDAAKLREAAILLHDWPESESYSRAIRLLARHVLATVPEDGEELVDEAWLKSIGFKAEFYSEEPDYVFTDDDGDGIMRVCRYGNIFICEEPDWPHDIHYKGQVRTIMAALGIQPTKTDSKL